MKTTQEAYGTIIESSIFKINGPQINLCIALIELCDAIKAEEETNWSIGEFETASLDSLIVGAYWALTEWHSGQSDLTYAALSQLGTIFNPGCASAPTEGEETSEYDAYKLICDHFEAGNK